jgi:hypothetical protein
MLVEDTLDMADVLYHGWDKEATRVQKDGLDECDHHHSLAPSHALYCQYLLLILDA